jgi:hypothetical protein
MENAKHTPDNIINSDSWKEKAMTNRIAEEDIVEVNGNGQKVVVVHAGQPIPEGLEVPDSAKKKPARSRGKKAEGEDE